MGSRIEDPRQREDRVHGFEGERIHRAVLEMTLLCISCTVWLPRKLEKIEKKRKYFFSWIFNIIADVDVLM